LEIPGESNKIVNISFYNRILWQLNFSFFIDKNKKIFTVQFHPEACPGPEDSNDIFDEFLSMI